MHALVRLTGATYRVKFMQPALTYCPGHSEWEAMEPSINSRLSMITLPDVDGKELRFGWLWVRQPAVVVFLRHYG